MLLRVFSKLSKLLSFFFLIQLFNATGTYQTYYHLFIIQSFWLFLFFKIDAEIIIISFFCYPLFLIIPYRYKKLSKLLSSLLLFTLFNYFFFFKKSILKLLSSLFLLSTLFDFSCQNHKGVLKFFFTVEVPAQLAC